LFEHAVSCQGLYGEIATERMLHRSRRLIVLLSPINLS